MTFPQDVREAVARAIWDKREEQVPPRVRTGMPCIPWPLMLEQAQAAITAAKPYIERELLRTMMGKVWDDISIRELARDLGHGDIEE